MKFCKNLQRVVDISDPEWAPYWTNYKMLKKLIKELPSLVPEGDSNGKATTAMRTRSASVEGLEDSPPKVAESSTPADESSPSSSNVDKKTQQKQGDVTAETKTEDGGPSYHQNGVATTSSDSHASAHTVGHRNDLDTIGKSPGEIAFFKLLHAEFKKATHFFDRAQQEYIIREERVRKGMEIMKQPNSIMVGEKWSLLAKSIYRLYKDLLLLETFAIMTYCGFSKILKKHDKVTGYHTRNAFMANIVNKANFTNYPKVLEMIARCEQLYEEVSHQLVQDGKQGLYEDERLFINMIHRLNEQVMENVDEEGVPGRPEPRKKSVARANVPVSSSKESWATSSLRQLVDEIDASRLGGQVSECNDTCHAEHASDSDADEDDRKQEAKVSAVATASGSEAKKRKAVDLLADVATTEKKKRT